jgi:modulator of FtsH protease HflK
VNLGLNDHHSDRGDHQPADGHDHQHDHHDYSNDDAGGKFGFGRQLLLSWLRRRWWLVVLLGYLLSGVYFVSPEQQAVVVRFGQVVAKGVTPGVHYSLPWPVEGVYKLKVLETKRLMIGIEIPDQVLGRTAAETPAEYFTGDQNLINVRMAVQFGVKDPAIYLFRSQDVTMLIAKAVEAAFVKTIAAEGVDSLLTTGKAAIQNATLIAAREMLDGYGSGVFISSINLENVAPPAEVAEAFRESISARADRDRIINEAHGYANDSLAKAQGEAEKLRQDAKGFRQQRINEAEGDAARFDKLLAESRKAKGVTERRLYLETMEEVLPRVKKVVIDSAGSKSLMDLGIIRQTP